MSVKITKKTYQARGQFNGGEILENKPIGFPREGGELKPYSNLFYWSHAWSEEGSTIGLHPHQGFEILSFVFDGQIEHYDSSDEEWKPIEKGGAQIIRSGNGISHSERLNAGAHMFQIWFDPNLAKALEKPASYNDYRDKDFPVEEMNGMQIKTYKGEGAPLMMDSPDVEIKEISLDAGKHELLTEVDKIYSYYLIEGSVATPDGEMEAHDFLRVEDENQLSVEAKDNSRFFLVVNPRKLDYLTYYQSAMANA
jgi:redox-sensitive bicupin YhaK (pirin superfamily)